MLIIDPAALEVMKQDAIKTFPDECCGFFFGTEQDGDRHIHDVLIVNNSKEGDRKRRFEISPRDYLQAELYADKHQLSMLGVYHSHPSSPAIPSEQDREAAQPYFSYIIISVYEKGVDHIRSWQLNENFQFDEEKIRNQVITIK